MFEIRNFLIVMTHEWNRKFRSNYYIDQDTIYSDNIEEREDAGTQAIIQKVRAALAFWIKEYIGYKAIARQEKSYIGRALERLVSNPHICVLGNATAKRQAILSFLVYSTTNPSSSNKIRPSSSGLDLWRETGNTIGKPLHGPFVAKLLNDLFGIEARGGCACAGPYGHRLLHVDEHQSFAFRSIIEKVTSRSCMISYTLLIGDFVVYSYIVIK